MRPLVASFLATARRRARRTPILAMTAIASAVGCGLTRAAPSPGPAFAPTLLTIDLTRNPGTTQTAQIPPGLSLVVRIVNRVPNAATFSYEHIAIVNNIPIPAFDTLNVRRDSALEIKGVVSDECKDVAGAIKALVGATDESQVPERVRDLQGALERLDYPDEEKCKELRPEATRVIDQTSFEIASLVVAAGQQLELTITRHQRATAETRIWRYIYTTGPRGSWRVAFGYAGIWFLDKGDQFFTTDSMIVTTTTTPTGPELDTTTVLRVTRGRQRDWWSDPLPIVFFTWMKTNRELRDLSCGPTAGLSIDSSQPRLFLGFQVTYNQNITVSVGGAYHPLDRLRGQYTEGMVVRESLTDDQLHVQRYRWNPFFAIAYRFNAATRARGR